MSAKLLVVAALFLARLVFAQAEKNAPSEFLFESNSYWPGGQSLMSVVYKEGMLSKSIHETNHSPNDQTIIATPTAAQWLAFRKTLDEIGVWRWKNQYDGTHGLSFRAGTSYRLVLKFRGRTIKSSGASKEPESFGRFKAAVDRLFAK